VTIIGVAKNRYRDSAHAFELLRGESKRPLFITAIGIDYEGAALHVASMAGDSRIPTLLHAVDRLSRGAR
jgi:deoxyribonuclease V